MMAAILISLMLLVWVSLGVYGKEAPAGCLMLIAAPLILMLMYVLHVLALVSTLGRKRIQIHVEDV